MTSDIFLGIDNGKSGAIAVIKGDTVIDVLPYPVDNPCMIFHFLQKNGSKDKLAALNPNSKNLFWVYVKDEKLNKLLDEWSANHK